MRIFILLFIIFISLFIYFYFVIYFYFLFYYSYILNLLFIYFYFIIYVFLFYYLLSLFHYLYIFILFLYFLFVFILLCIFLIYYLYIFILLFLYFCFIIYMSILYRLFTSTIFPAQQPTCSFSPEIRTTVDQFLFSAALYKDTRQPFTFYQVNFTHDFCRVQFGRQSSISSICKVTARLLAAAIALYALHFISPASCAL